MHKLDSNKGDSVIMKLGKKILPVALCAALALSGCSAGTGDSNLGGKTTPTNKNAEASVIQVDTSGYDLEFSNRDSNSTYDESSATKVTFDESATISGEGASANGNVITITKAGTYIMSGTSTDAQINVSVGDDDKVQLVFSGVDLTCNSGPCLNVQSGDKVFVTLAEGTTNTLSDGSGFSVGDEDELDSTIYSKSDITFNGSGTLKINATAGHGIHSKDDLVVTSGVFEITSTKSGMVGKDCVKIKDGTLTITSQTDCIKSTNSDDEGRGFVSVDGGTFNLKSTDKGIQATKLIRLAGGNLTIESQDDTVHSDHAVQICGARLELNAGDDAIHANDQLEVNAGEINVAKCYEGLEAYEITVSGGTTEIHATDDGVNAAQSNSSSDVTEDENGDTVQTTQDPQNNTEKGGTDQQNPPAKPEGDAQNGQNTNSPQSGQQSGQQGQPPAKPEGDASVNSEEQMTPPNGDMQKPEGANDQGAQAGGNAPNGQFGDGQQGGQPGGNKEGGQGGGATGPGANQGASIAITGGTLTVYAADGDGLDSNGSILMTGGTVTLVGPSNNGNSALDFDGTGTINGGTFFAIGSSGMAQNFGSTSSQASVAAQANGNAGDVVSVTDSSGNVIVSFTSNCAYSYVQASASNITEGQTYKILANGSELTTANATSNQSSGIAPQGGGAGGGGAQRQGNKQGEQASSSSTKELGGSNALSA